MGLLHPNFCKRVLHINGFLLLSRSELSRPLRKQSAKFCTCLVHYLFSSLNLIQSHMETQLEMERNTGRRVGFHFVSDVYWVLNPPFCISAEKSHVRFVFRRHWSAPSDQTNYHPLLQIEPLRHGSDWLALWIPRCFWFHIPILFPASNQKMSLFSEAVTRAATWSAIYKTTQGFVCRWCHFQTLLAAHSRHRVVQVPMK